jgi:hypothetical protein
LLLLKSPLPSLVFASLVAIIGQRRGHDEPSWDAARLEGMLELSLFTCAFALLPFIPYNAGLSQSAAWRVCAGAFAAPGLLLSLHALRKLRKIPGYTAATAWGLLWIGLSTAAQIALATAALGLMPRPAVVYLAGLYTYLAMAALTFLRLVRSLLAEQKG